MTRAFTLLFCSIYLSLTSSAQTSVAITQAVNKLQQDSQMMHALLGCYVVNSTTGETICNINGNMGMIPASAQKIVTAATAFELLGTDYRYKTIIGYDGDIRNGTLNGNLYIAGQGDPTLGSPRYASTKRDVILNRILSTLSKNGIQSIQGDIILDGSQLSYQATPDGWAWNDIGNYYGASCWGINWNENQYDLFLQSGDNEGDDVKVIKSNPPLQQSLVPLLKAGKKGIGDNADIYLPPNAAIGYIEGAIPAGEKSFKITGSLPSPYFPLAEELLNSFDKKGLILNGNVLSSAILIENGKPIPHYTGILDTIYSPPLDSIVYCFLEKSINLYGESLAKIIAVEQHQPGSTKSGVNTIRTFWQARGIEKSALKMVDGSGLSPQNRVTPQSLVQVLQYAKKSSWYPAYYKSFPTYNNMKMKSGTISGTKAFAGYHTSTNGTPYTFAIIVNNYDGAASAIVQKMYTLLNTLK